MTVSTIAVQSVAERSRVRSIPFAMFSVGAKATPEIRADRGFRRGTSGESPAPPSERRRWQKSGRGVNQQLEVEVVCRRARCAQGRRLALHSTCARAAVTGWLFVAPAVRTNTTPQSAHRDFGLLRSAHARSSIGALWTVRKLLWRTLVQFFPSSEQHESH